MGWWNVLIAGEMFLFFDGDGVGGELWNRGADKGSEDIFTCSGSSARSGRFPILSWLESSVGSQIAAV